MMSLMTDVDDDDDDDDDKWLGWYYLFMISVDDDKAMI